MTTPIKQTLLASLLGLSSLNLMADEQKHILMVLSSYGETDAQGELIKPGYEFDEMSKSYLVFKAAGAKVTFASPKGGKVLADKYNKAKQYNAKFLDDKSAVAQLENTQKLATLNHQDFDAVYVVGGKGPMFDLATDNSVKQIIKQVYENDGVIGAVCHGPAALLDVKLSSGEYLLAGKRVSGFTNLEESAFTKKWQMPFSLANKLSEQGALYQQDSLMFNQVSFDGNLLTGQNPFSTTDTAIAVAKKLGLTLEKNIEFKDDRTIKLAEQFVADKTAALATYNASKQDYDSMLLAMLGVYLGKHAQSQMERDAALTLLKVTSSDINHPAIELAIAKTLLADNDFNTAKNHLSAAQKKFPENPEIATLLTNVQSL